MADTPNPPSDAERLAAQLNQLDHLPTWAQAASLGVQLVDLSREERAVRNAITDLEQASRSFDGIVEAELAAATAADLADHWQRLKQIEARSGRYFVANGDVVQRDDIISDAYKAGTWYDQRTTLVTNPHGERVHHPGIHPDAAIDPTATVDPTARVEPGATIGPHARIGAYTHVAGDAAVGAHSVVQNGSWIGTNTQLGPHTWVSQGVTVDPHCIIGHHTTIGAGSRIEQRAEIEPYSRLGAGTTTSPAPRSNRSAHIASAVENIMRLDRE